MQTEYLKRRRAIQIEHLFVGNHEFVEKLKREATESI